MSQNRTRSQKKHQQPDQQDPLFDEVGLTTPDFRLIAIDPGDVYTGVAFFNIDEDGGWYCTDAQEFDPEDFEDALAETLLMDMSEPLIVVFEKWRLYADHAMEKTGSEFPTSQHIGVIKYLVRVRNIHAKRHSSAARKGKMLTCELADGRCGVQPVVEVEIYKQPADIKKPTTGILHKKSIKSVAKPIAKELYHNRDHVVDAELHGWHHILKTMGENPSDTA